MRFMVLVKANAESEGGRMPTTDELATMGKYNQQLADAGVMIEGNGLRPSSQAARVRFSDDEPTVIDGPFAETKELVAGYWVWECKSRQEAIDWLKKAPFGPGAEVEIREIQTPEDFGENWTPELQAREDALAKQTGQK